jgi:ribosomal protein S18 acetylase RimI-like enzyme
MGFTISKAQAKDLDNLWRIYAEGVGPNAERKDEYWRILIREGGMVVADGDGQAVGFGGIDVKATEQIKYIYVASGFQKVGIGKAILERLEEIGAQAGLSELILHANPAAIDFYKRAGYTAIANDIAHDHEGVMMMKRIR